MNILFHQGALGDWVLTFPILRALRPTLAVTTRSKARLAAALIADVTATDIEQPDTAHLFVADGTAAIGAAWRGRLAAAPVIVSFLSSGRDTWAANVRHLAPQALLACVDPHPPADWRGHVSDWHASRLAAAGLTLAPPAGSPRATVRRRGAVLVHPGSGGRAKCWPPDRFAALIAALRRAGRSVRPVLGEVEAERWAPGEARRWQRDLGARLLGSLDALRLELAGASLFVGNDAGPTHLAAAMGVPAVALFGPTDPMRWAPRGDHVRVVAPPEPAPMTWLDIDTALAACRAAC